MFVGDELVWFDLDYQQFVGQCVVLECVLFMVVDVYVFVQFWCFGKYFGVLVDVVLVQVFVEVLVEIQQVGFVVEMFVIGWVVDYQVGLVFVWVWFESCQFVLVDFYLVGYFGMFDIVVCWLDQVWVGFVVVNL